MILFQRPLKEQQEVKEPVLSNINLALLYLSQICNLGDRHYRDIDLLKDGQRVSLTLPMLDNKT